MNAAAAGAAAYKQGLKHHYLKHAWDAVNHSSVIWITSTHYSSDLILTLGMATPATWLLRSSINEKLLCEADPYKHIEVRAEMAERWHVGNCEEFASSCFQFLINRTISPLDYFHVTSPFQHAFVVLGRPADSDPTDLSTWGETAVVCDGWDGKAFEATRMPGEFKRFWRRGQPNPMLKLRWAP